METTEKDQTLEDARRRYKAAFGFKPVGVTLKQMEARIAKHEARVAKRLVSDLRRELDQVSERVMKKLGKVAEAVPPPDVPGAGIEV